MSAGRNSFHGWHLAILHQECKIKIVYRGTNMAWKEIEWIANLW